ncbi:MAG: alanine racemase C-terminal domain-containing protein, partial [Roseiarcus sp.]
ADGLPRGAGAVDGRAGAEVVIAGRRCPLVGRMSMDLCIADVTDLPEDAVKPGDFARFLGEEIGLDEFASRSGTIGYAVLTSLGARYARRVVEG